MIKKISAALVAVAVVVAMAFAGGSKPILTLQYVKSSGAACADMGNCAMGQMGCCDMGAKGRSADNSKSGMSGKDMCGSGSVCGVSEKEIKRAYSTLKHDLAAKGVKVKLDKVKGKDVPTVAQSDCQVWFSDVPVETWLGSKMSDGACKDMAQGGCTSMIVQAGNKAADHLLTNGKIDAAELTKPKTGCGGCSGKAGCGGMSTKADVKTDVKQ